MFKLLLAAAVAVVGVVGQYSVPASSSNASATFTNPILETGGADPWVFTHGDYYYMTYTNNENITMYRSKALTDWNNAESKLIFKPEEGMPYSTDLWAPEIHHINDEWYVIFTADPRNDSPSPEVDMWCEYNCPAVHHRMFVVHGKGDDPWEAKWEYKAELNTFDQFAIDGTYFVHTGKLYHIYSCWEAAYSAWPANLCITKMDNPWTVSSNFSERQIISVPSLPWEKTPYGKMTNDRLSSNEGPQQLVAPNGRQFIIYSAARSDNRNYCLGQLELVGNDPMNPSDWQKHPYPIFYQNPKEEAYGVGHASFTTSPDSTENWIVYHGMEDPSNGWYARTIRTQKFEWSDEGTPKFPKPGYGPYEVPSGQ